MNADRPPKFSVPFRKLPPRPRWLEPAFASLGLRSRLLGPLGDAGSIRRFITSSIPGRVTRPAIALIERILKPNRRFEFWKDEEEFYRYGAKALRSNCVLDPSKLFVAGIRMRPVEEALEDALRNWTVAALRFWGGVPQKDISLLPMQARR